MSGQRDCRRERQWKLPFCWGVNRDCHKDPFPHSLLEATSQAASQLQVCVQELAEAVRRNAERLGTDVGSSVGSIQDIWSPKYPSAFEVSLSSIAWDPPKQSHSNNKNKIGNNNNNSKNSKNSKNSNSSNNITNSSNRSNSYRKLG